MKLFGQTADCCGCYACMNICPIQCIRMIQDVEGFYYPEVDKSSCINCGLCQKVCPLKHADILKQTSSLETYALYHKDEKILNESTSGGAFTAIAEAFCDSNYVVFGAELEKNFKVNHQYITDIKHLSLQRKSKYVQSNIGNTYSQAKGFLEKGKKVLFSGTPCQIAGLKSFLHKSYENLLTIELICHGVPSSKLFDIYLNDMRNTFKSDIHNIVFRDKSKHWEPHKAIIVFKSGNIYSKIGVDDPYQIAFYSNLVMRPSCYECPFATVPRVADFTIGDFWGVEKIKPHLDNDKGLSVLLVNSQKARQLLSKVKEIAYIETADLQQVIQNNPQLKEPTKPNPKREQFMSDMQKLSFDLLEKKYLKPRPMIIRLATKFLSKKTKQRIKRIIGLNH